ncbi:MAG: NAD(P)-dependent alcohol dehydrogenase [Pseudomonadota bacterium]
MKALVNLNKTLNLVSDAAQPTLAKGEVKVRVHFASLNPTDLEIAEGKQDFFLKLFRVKSPVRTGLEFSGTVMEDSTRFEKGDRVFGYTHLIKGPKTHQEILCIPEDYVARIPGCMSFAEAAAFPLGAQTSLVALRDVAKLKSGQSVLINGGSGGVGIFAIQIAKSMGVRVTAVSGPDGLESMAALGADTVLNYRETKTETMTGAFDAILDLSNKLYFGQAKHLLVPRGTFIPADPTQHLASFAGNLLRKKKVGYLFVDRGNGKILDSLSEQVANGSLDATRFQEFGFTDFQEAIDALNRPGNIGRIVLRLVP